jgi:hypothetical protein
MSTEVQPPKPPSLVSKLAAAMKEVGRIPKSGRNDFHKYDYVTEADLVDAIRDKLSDRNVFLFTSIESTAHAGDITEVFTVHTFVDGDTGESFSVKGYGQGQDKGDKGGYKAQTGAMKYALMKNFLVATGDDPEQHDDKAAKAPPKAAVDKVIQAVKKPPAPPTVIKIMEVMNEQKLLQPLQVAYDKALTYTHWTDEEKKTLAECYLGDYAKLSNWIREGYTMLNGTGDVLAIVSVDKTGKATVKEAAPKATVEIIAPATPSKGPESPTAA